MTITTYLFGLWLLLSGGAVLLPWTVQVRARAVLLGAAPVLIALSALLQGWFPALMILGAVVMMEPGPLRWLLAQGWGWIAALIPGRVPA